MSTIAVSGAGLIASVGRGAGPACAAIRAGIARVRPVTHFFVLDDQEHEMVPLDGNPVAHLTDGFAPAPRWSLMAERAIDDLFDGLLAPRGNRINECAVVFVLPVLDDARFFYAPGCRPDELTDSFLFPVLRRLSARLAASSTSVVTLGSAGLGHAIDITDSLFDNGDAKAALIIAVDSLLDPWSLLWLSSSGRLKDSTNPMGLSPGEAAVALLVEPATPSASPRARIKSSAFVAWDNPYLNDERRLGRELSSTLRTALSDEAPSLRGDVHVNLNGEPWRSAEWGSALAAVPGGTRAQFTLRVIAESVGDVGAAGGALAVACALHAFERGYATEPEAWVLTTSDDGEVSALCMERAS